MFKYLLAVLAFCPLFGQFEPESAHVRLYFPQLVDGGDDVQKWQTTFVIVNPNLLQAATVNLTLRNERGGPLQLNFGAGAASTHSFTIPPSGSKTIRSAAVSRDIVVGWAIMDSDVPVSATVLFRANDGGKPTVDLSAPATLPTVVYRSAANRQLGIALANPSYTSSIALTLKAMDSAGRTSPSVTITLDPLSHTSFVLSERMPNLANDFEGSIMILSETFTSPFVAWTLNSDRGLLSTLPSGGLRWPPSHPDRMILTASKAYNAAQAIASTYKVDLKNPGVQFEFGSESSLNAFTSGTRVHVSILISQLLSDSESELGFIVAHQLGHIIQARAGRNVLVPNNAEQDADAMAMLIALTAGFDVYAGGGALGRLAMFTKQANLVAANFDNLADPYTSFLSRIDAMYVNLANLCSNRVATNCVEYKQLVHPDFPGRIPLSNPGTPALR